MDTITVSELIKKLQEFEAQGHSDKGVYFESYGCIETVEYNEKGDKINIDKY